MGGQVTPGDSNYTNAAYYASLSQFGIGPWTNTTSYPTDIAFPSCVASSGYIYCVGGLTFDGTFTNASRYAPLSQSGISSWASTTPFPIKVVMKSCTASDGYMYCVGGLNGSGFATNAVYYAPLSSSGIGQWTRGTNYPTDLFFQSCVALAGYLYCIGGAGQAAATSSVYYAALSSGVSSWTNTTRYPTPISHLSCTVSAGYVYCVGGFLGNEYASKVYFAPLSPSGISFWTSTSPYPTKIIEQPCVASGGYLYCVGGSDDFGADTRAAYYAPIVPFSTTTATTSVSTSTVTNAETTTLTNVVTSTVTTTERSTQISITTQIGSGGQTSTFAGALAGLAIGALIVVLVLKRRRPAS